jgi:glycosyltransferase involved in cell wall biosynthesis
MLLENNPYPRDVRVRAEAETLVRAGYEVAVVAPRGHGQPRRETVNGVEVRRFRCVDGGRHGAAGYLAEYLIAATALHLAAVRALIGGSSYLHLHNPPDILFGAAALYRLAGRAVIFDHHDLAPETIEAKLGPGPFVRLARICERLTFACATHVLSTNSSYAEIALGRGGKSPDQVTVVRNGPPAAWTAVPLRVREGSLEQVRLAYVGTLSSQDGVEGLAPVLAGLRALEPPIDAVLEIIGDGDARPRLEAEFARHGVADRVAFSGWVALERVPELLAAADVCVDPAPASEVNQRSTMIKLAEYLALGKPVVAYDLLESRRTVAGAALLVAAGDVDAFTAAIARLAGDPELRSRLAGEARQRAGELTWEHSEEALIAAYARLARRR